MAVERVVGFPSAALTPKRTVLGRHQARGLEGVHGSESLDCKSAGAETQLLERSREARQSQVHAMGFYVVRLPLWGGDEDAGVARGVARLDLQHGAGPQHELAVPEVRQGLWGQEEWVGRHWRRDWYQGHSNGCHNQDGKNHDSEGEAGQDVKRKGKSRGKSFQGECSVCGRGGGHSQSRCLHAPTWQASGA